MFQSDEENYQHADFALCPGSKAFLVPGDGVKPSWSVLLTVEMFTFIKGNMHLYDAPPTKPMM